MPGRQKHDRDSVGNRGAGVIGRWTVQALLSAGFNVRVMDNHSPSLKDMFKPWASQSLQYGDVRLPSDCKKLMKGGARVIHLAAQVSVPISMGHPRTSSKTNVNGFLNVLGVARKEGVKKFVYASSAAVYGVPKTMPIREEHELGPISPYGAEKMVNEVMAGAYERCFGMKCLGLRYFNVFGPGQKPDSGYAGVISLFMDRMLKEDQVTIFGDGNQTRDFIYVADVALCNVAAVTSDRTGVSNVGTGQATSLKRLVATMRSLIPGSKEPRFVEGRDGDIRHSQACVSTMLEHLPVPVTDLEGGLLELLEPLR